MKPEIGTAITTAQRTITDTDIVNFAGLSGDFNPLHTDDIYAAEVSPFGRRVAHGQLIASIVTGLRSPLDEWPVLSYLGARRRFLAPVFAGDTIHGEYQVTEVRESRSQPGNWVVTLELRVVNQEGIVAIDGQDVFLVGEV